MSTKRLTPYITILAIVPKSRGFGFVVLEARGKLVAWGVARLYSAHQDEYLLRLEGLVLRYRVRILALEAEKSRRGERAKQMIAQATQLASSRRLTTTFASRKHACKRIGLPSATKHELAARLAEEFPDLAVHLPEPRKIWQSEDQRMLLFEAMAIAIAALPYSAPQ